MINKQIFIGRVARWPVVWTSVVMASIAFMGTVTDCTAQKRYIDRAGKASFFSSAPMENIEAHNAQVVSVLDLETGDVVASMLMRSFNFKKALMQEHFNENYVESHKYPKATFKGRIANLEDLKAPENGKFKLDIAGEITIHGVTQPLVLEADVQVNNGIIQAKAVFPLAVKDFKIEVPRLVINNIAEVVEVTVSFNYKPI
jgi:polyisoprenoid-binding protein YceI